MPNISRHDVELWVKTIATGEFHYKNVMGLQGRLEPQADNKLRKIIFDLCQAGVCESVGKHDGYYRIVQSGVQPVDFTNIQRGKSFPLILPFNLRKYVFIYPNTVTIVAGSKSSGKTGFLYRTVELNLGKLNIKLLSNMEGGSEQIYDRFLAMGIDLAKKDRFVYPVYDNYHDYIKEPDTIYIIDYIDVPEGTDFYLIGGLITKIRKRLDNSVAVIGLQKPTTRDIAFGGEQTLKDSALYIAMDNSKLKIVDAKVPADKKVHPKNMQWTFQYDDEGTNFLNILRSYGDGE